MKFKIYQSLVILSYVIKIIFLLTIALAVYNQEWLTVFVASLAFILSFFPSLLERNYKINLPIELEMILLLFIFGSLLLGEVHSYYTRFWWWDIALHTFSGLILGMIGFLIIYILNFDKKVHLHLTPGFIAVFSFTFALSLGAIWEIFEFSMDQIFGLNMQKSGLLDTMGDLIVDSIGALVVSIGGYFYVKKVEVPFLTRAMQSFAKENPQIFDKKQKVKKN